MVKVHFKNKNQVYFSMIPTENNVMKILQDLIQFKSHISTLTQTLRKLKLSQFPDIIKNVKLLVEFSDCILQAKDLISY